ncbi:MAG TPA: hypothetical protein VFA32_01055, partial [Dehalococcoidia bacterium]|nr:hypothetical protein [Dehalococcoidia bacterium]
IPRYSDRAIDTTIAYCDTFFDGTAAFRPTAGPSAVSWPIRPTTLTRTSMTGSTARRRWVSSMTHCDRERQ